MKRLNPVILIALLPVFCCWATPPPLRISAGKLTAANQEIHLRGINWGWWHLKGTVYTEEHMHKQAEWGANVVRLAMTYTDIANEDGSWNEQRFAEVDEVVQWAKRYNQYVILDMHVAKGGQNTARYTDGGRNLLWHDEKLQELLCRQWTELARRYRNEPTVAAYEILNEPGTKPRDPSLVTALNRKVIQAIRSVDREKIIVVSGDDWSNAQSLVDEIKVDDPNILYTFHFYDGAFGNYWLGNVGENENSLSGTREWTEFKLPLEIPEGTRLTSLLLRSTSNSGSAWFDDIRLTDETGKTIYHFSFDQDSDQFKMERAPESCGAYDAEVGHAAPGSLRVRKSSGYNGWIGPRWKLAPGKYVVSGQIKLENATGQTYLAAALFGPNPRKSDAELRRKLAVPVAFARKHNVPVLVGEFAVTRDSGPGDHQARATKQRIELFEEYGFHWIYWNYRETTGPDTMALQAQKPDGSDYPVNAPLLEVLMQGWSLNHLEQDGNMEGGK